jgi:predicted transcriptional regulator
MLVEENFFGRAETLELLKKRTMDLKEGCRQNIAILGTPYVGKSSLLKHFVANLDDERIITIYLDLENKDFRYFFTKFVGSLLYNYSKLKKLPLHEDLSLLMESTHPYLPQTTAVLRKIMKDFVENKLHHVYLGLLTVMEIFANETDVFCVLIIDEFHVLEEFSINDVFQELGKKIMTQRKCLYVLSSSYAAAARKIISEKLSLLFGNFEVLHVEPFDFKTSRLFIKQSLKSIRVNSPLDDFLTDFCGGHPLYLNLICQEIASLSAIFKQQEVFLPLVSQAVENTIFDRWGGISRHFELILNDLCGGKGNRLVAMMLIELSNGKNRVDELQDVLNTSKVQINQKLVGLTEQGIIVKNGHFYCFKDKLFRYWVKYVYQKRLKDVELAPDKQRRQFQEEFNRSFENFKISSGKDLSSRVAELLYCFDNESLDLNGRKYKLPSFREMTALRIPSSRQEEDLDVIKATTGESHWYIVMKKDHFDENDVNAVMSEIKRSGERPERCLIISLTDLEQNTKIRALQEKFWIWNERELNTLLTLFDKPFIPR